jgi:hypothetical protein
MFEKLLNNDGLNQVYIYIYILMIKSSIFSCGQVAEDIIYKILSALIWNIDIIYVKSLYRVSSSF